MTRIASTSRQGKALIFKPKAPSFYTAEFSYIDFFPIENRPNFRFLGRPEQDVRARIKNKYLFSWNSVFFRRELPGSKI